MFLHEWIPSSTVAIGGLSLSFYGMMMGLALISAYIIALLVARRFDRMRGTHIEDHIDGLFWWIFVPALLGARVLFIAYHPDYFASAAQEAFMIWHGGIVWHGALIGGIAGSAAYCRWKKISWFDMADILAPALALGQAIGRWGNYFNQENYGLPTDLPWGIPVDFAHRLAGYEQHTYFHPAFLYESMGNSLLFVALLYLVYHGILKKQVQKYRSGMIFMLYLAMYSLGRFAIEFLRVDIVPVVWGMRMPQWWSIGIVTSIVLLFIQLIKKPRSL